MYFEITTVSGEFVYINLQQITAVEPVEHAVCTSDGSKYKMTHESYDELIKNLGIVQLLFTKNFWLITSNLACILKYLILYRAAK